jgi:hypothetical protein
VKTWRICQFRISGFNLAGENRIFWRSFLQTVSFFFSIIISSSFVSDSFEIEVFLLEDDDDDDDDDDDI